MSLEHTEKKESPTNASDDVDLPIDDNTVVLNENIRGVFQDTSVCFDQMNLPKTIMSALDKSLFTYPSAIQARGIPLLLQEPPRNMIAQAHAGSGKTLTFAIGILLRLNYEVNLPQALVLCPTRELAIQNANVISNFGHFTPLNLYQCVKDCDRSNVTSHVVVGTPGKILDKIMRRQIDTRHVRIFVLDEADLMVEQHGFGDNMIKIRKKLPQEVQVCLFSATFPRSVRSLATYMAPNAIRVTVKRQQISLQNVKQFYINCKSLQGKYDQLYRLYGTIDVGEAIIFVEATKTAQWLTEKLRKQKFNVSALYGRMATADRDKCMADFREGKTTILITTNVLARGIDVQHVRMVVNFDIPVSYQDGKADPETYIHRVGRTGRFGRAGIAINFIETEKDLQLLQSIARYYERDIFELPFEDDAECERIVNLMLRKNDVPGIPRIYGKPDDQKQQQQEAAGSNSTSATGPPLQQDANRMFHISGAPAFSSHDDSKGKENDSERKVPPPDNFSSQMSFGFGRRELPVVANASEVEHQHITGLSQPLKHDAPTFTPLKHDAPTFIPTQPQEQDIGSWSSAQQVMQEPAPSSQQVMQEPPPSYQQVMQEPAPSYQQVMQESAPSQQVMQEPAQSQQSSFGFSFPSVSSSLASSQNQPQSDNKFVFGMSFGNKPSTKPAVKPVVNFFNIEPQSISSSSAASSQLQQQPQTQPQQPPQMNSHQQNQRKQQQPYYQQQQERNQPIKTQFQHMNLDGPQADVRGRGGMYADTNAQQQFGDIPVSHGELHHQQQQERQPPRNQFEQIREIQRAARGPRQHRCRRGGKSGRRLGAPRPMNERRRQQRDAPIMNVDAPSDTWLPTEMNVQGEGWGSDED